MTPHQRFLACMRFREVDRAPNWEMGYWAGALEQFYEQGLPRHPKAPKGLVPGAGVKGEGFPWLRGEPKDWSVHAYFGLDKGIEKIDGEWGVWPPFETEVLWEDEENIKRRAADGSVVLVRRDSSSLPHVLEWPVTDRKSWEKLKEERLHSLLTLSQMGAVSDAEIRTYALEEIVRLTRSKAGYLHFVDEDTHSLELVAWSKDVRKACRAHKPRHFPLDKAGVWADCVRLRRPVIHNDFSKVPDKKGMPEGHFPIHRHMSVPVMDNGRVVAVAGVGNKASDYDASDANQLTLFMTSMWSIIKQKRAHLTL